LTADCWLTDDTISRGSWSYTENLEIKPTKEVLHSLIDSVSKNNFTLYAIVLGVPEPGSTVTLQVGRLQTTQHHPARQRCRDRMGTHQTGHPDHHARQSSEQHGRGFPRRPMTDHSDIFISALRGILVF